MLARHHRFRGSRDIQRLYKNGLSVRTKLLGLRYRVNPERPYHAAVVVSRKVHKSAVVRNRIRRRLYELLRTQQAESIKGAQMIISAFDPSLSITPGPRLEHELSMLLSKARGGGRPKTDHDIVKDTGE